MQADAAARRERLERERKLTRLRDLELQVALLREELGLEAVGAEQDEKEIVGWRREGLIMRPVYAGAE
ncbi:hypothetical protein ACFQ9J_13690 [Streptomyces sp. NPDC056529]|uniref:hypothetical protein n=1 Tax=Streptomyces sp. NPDC056529 TaxID=3345855 RepID=UPI0036C98A86